MIALPPATRIWLACGVTDMRKGMCGLAVMAQEVLKQNPHSGAAFAFRGRSGDLIKLLWYDGQLYAIEAENRGQPVDIRRSIRQERSRPLVAALRAALDDALRKLSPKSPMTKAIRYGTKRWRSSSDLHL